MPDATISDAPNGTSSIIAIIPSLQPEGRENLEALQASLVKSGAKPVVVANSQRLVDNLSGSDVIFVASNANDGFGASISRGLKEFVDWSWMLIVNDDTSIDARVFSGLLESLHSDSRVHGRVVFFDAEAPRHAPTPVRVFLSISLLSRLIPNKPDRLQGPSPIRLKKGYYKSFSVVAISRSAWEAVGGFDESLPFTYEDADFARRAHELDIELFTIPDSGVVHAHSSTTARWVEFVLPVATWSAFTYLDKWFGHRSARRFLCQAALIVRVPVVLVTGRARRRNVKAVGRSIRALAQDLPPALPSFEEV